MERSPVNPDNSPANPQIASAPASGWGATHNASGADVFAGVGAGGTFSDQMENVLGLDAEPDPLFFVETWTLGLDTAAQNFQARHQNTHQNTHHTHQGRSQGTRHWDGGASGFRSFDFSVPLVFVQDVLPSTLGDREEFLPAGFSAAWKSAYGVRPSGTHVGPKSAASREEALPQMPGLPITAEDAFRLLGVCATSTRKEIKSAYRQLVWRYHPDRLEHPTEQDQRIATDRMTAINEAYRLLCGPAVASV